MRTYRYLSLAFVLAVLPWAANAEPTTAELDALITQTMADWKVPGASVAIVRGDQPLLLKGYGLRDVEKNKPATEKTLFRLASVTKSFTAAGVAALVSQGKLEWDKPVNSYLPEFQLYSPELTAQVTPVDMLSHRTGLPRHDSVWYFNRDFAREDLVRRMRYLEPNKPLRQTWQYNNFMFLAAGYLTGRMLNTSWEDAVNKLLFKPLEMKTTNISITEMEAHRDHAEPYAKDKNEVVQKVPNYPGNNIAPAGQINSNAVDMSHYITMLMNDGMYKDKQVLARADVQKMTSAQMVVGPSDPRYPEMGDSSYGLGLSVTTYRGHRMVHHGGALDGFRAHLVFLPEQKLGIVVLSNLGGVNFVTAVSNDLFDRLLNLEPRNWSARYLSDQKKSKAAQDEAEARGLSPRKTGTQPSHALADYAGHYEHPGYGAVRVEQRGAGLNVGYGFLDTALNHYHYDSFEFVTNPVSQSKLTVRFETDAEGNIASLTAPMDGLGAAIVFQRVAEPRMRTREFLLPFTGKYELGATMVELVLRDNNTLAFVQPTGAALALEPLRGSTFRVKDRAGWSLEFKGSEAVLHQPGSSSVLKRMP